MFRDRLMLVFFVAAVLLVAVVARADEPQFGACWADGVCIGPRVAAPAMAVDLKTGDVQFGVLPGFGYGVEKRGAHLTVGISAFMNVRDTANGQRVAPALMFDFMKYVHIGVARQFGDEKWLGLLTLGTDLGSTTLEK